MTHKNTYQFEAIGTHWAIDTDVPLLPAEKQYIQQLISDFDQTYSRFRADSLVSQVRQAAPGPFVFPPTIVTLYDMYQRLEKVTHGAVNPLVGEALENLGYDANYSLRPTTTASLPPAGFTKTVTRSGQTLTFAKPALLDIGAIGKGYLVDLVAAHVAQGHKYYSIDAGGDMAIAAARPLVIGLEHPLDLTQIIGTVTLDGKSICASAPNRRAWGKGLHHIIDATTGAPAKTDVVATWAIADTTVVADALTTALFFVPAAQLRHDFGDFRYILMKSDGSVEHDITTI